MHPGLISVLVLLPLFTDVADCNIQNQVKEVVKKCRLSLQLSCPDKENIKFHLFTRKNTEKSQVVEVSKKKDNFDQTSFNPDHPNKVIIHGFSPRSYKKELKAVKDAYLTKEEANVWMVDWKNLANGGPCVLMSFGNVVHVAECTAQLIRAIKRHAPQADIHVVAERVGVKIAHRMVQEIKPVELTRITGLNPEGGVIPGEKGDRLTSADAAFVDTIHTSPLLPTAVQFGHIDFYVNPNRLHQPGCDNSDRETFVCDQARAIEYFAESITSDVGFVGWNCPSYTNLAVGLCNPQPPPKTMGDSCSKEAPGIYVVYTSDWKPYALGHWNGKLYQDLGPKTRNDFISKYSTSIKRNLQLIEGKTPSIVKELGILDDLKTALDGKKEDITNVAIEIGVKGIKALATHFAKNKSKGQEESADKAGDNITKNANDKATKNENDNKADKTGDNITKNANDKATKNENDKKADKTT